MMCCTCNKVIDEDSVVRWVSEYLGALVFCTLKCGIRYGKEAVDDANDMLGTFGAWSV